MHTTTLGELGAQAPIGSIEGKQLWKAFTLRPYTGHVDRNLAHWMRAASERYPSAGQRVAAQTAKLLSLLVTDFGGKQLPALEAGGDSSAAAELAVHKWFFADAMYAYLYARVVSLGPMLEHPVACPSASCTFSSDAAQFDLTTMDVRVADSLDDLHLWVPIKRPYKLRDGQTVLNQVKLQPTPWSALVKPGVVGGAMSRLTMEVLLDVICGINGSDQEYRFTPSELDDMERIDRVSINRAADKVTAGASLKTQFPCPKCGVSITNSMDWEFGYFFDGSLPLEI